MCHTSRVRTLKSASSEGADGMARTQGLVRLVGVSLILVLVGGCGALSADKAGGTAGQKPRILTMANAGGDPAELDGFIKEVARLSSGTIRIQVESRWRADQAKAEPGLINDVKAGKADLGWAGSRAWDAVGVTSLRALHAPLLIDSHALQERVVQSPLVAEMLRGLNPLGLVGLGVLPGPMRKPLGISKPLVGPADYAGLRIGVQQSLVANETMRALGARPVWFPAMGAIVGLDGIEQQIGSIDGNRYDKVGKYLTANVNLWPRPLVIFTSNKVFDSLSPDQRNALRQAATNVIPSETAFLRGDEQEAAGNLCRRKVTFETASRGQLAALRTAVQPVHDTLARDPQTSRFLAAIAAISKGVAAEPAPNCRATGKTDGQAAGGSSPLDGVYRVTTTAKDLRAAGTPLAAIIPENYGTATYVFDRARFAFTEENKDACIWGYGTFALKGNQVEWRFTDGGGTGPNNAFNRPGESFVYGWSLYRETLTLTPVQGAVSPEPFRAKPWRRIGTTPSSRYLSKRCPPPGNALPR
jgi:TRAP-type C4-dicarboxylate transport system substrate-binding protein